jgi:hypothetical protein
VKILIDRSTIRRNPNAGQTSIRIPGKSYMKNGITFQPFQTIQSLCPDPDYLFEYIPKDVQCSSCGATFDYSLLESDCICSWEIDIDDYAYSDTVCPKCKAWNCCEIEFEEFDAETMGRGNKAWSSPPVRCPFCGAPIVACGKWTAHSIEDPENTATLIEYQCIKRCEGRSFWA